MLKTPDIHNPAYPLVKVALCQVRTEAWELESNFSRTIAQLDEAAEQGAHIAITPECVLHGYAPLCDAYKEKMLQIAQPVNGEMIAAFKERAATHGMHVVLGFAEIDKQSNIYNTAITIDNHGKILSHYRKVHCRDFESITGSGVFKAGSEFLVRSMRVDAETYKVGTMICFDREIPETVRCLRSLGAELIACPLATDTDGFFDTFVNNESITRVRAAENEVFIAVVNHSGRFNGGSFLVGPGGEIVHKMDGRPGVAIASIHLRVVYEQFHKQPYGWMGWGYRRADVYQKHM